MNSHFGRQAPRGNSRTQVLIALIGAAGFIIAAWIGTCSAQHQDRANSPKARSTQPAETADISEPPHQSDQWPRKQPQLYETTATIKEGNEAFIDSESGLVFAVDDVYDWGFLRLRGATCRYSVPDSRWLRHGKREIGHRESYSYRDRNFMLVIEAIDYEDATVTIKILEV